MNVKNTTAKIYNRIKSDNYGSLYLMRLLSSWLVSCLVGYIAFSGIFRKEYAGEVNPFVFIGVFAAAYGLLTALRFIPKIKSLKTDCAALLLITAFTSCYLCYISYFEKGRGIDTFIALAPFVALCVWVMKLLSRDKLIIENVKLKIMVFPAEMI